MPENIIIIPSDELYHSGILGMKWGFRRFQNKDGSLTPAGRERYGVGSKKESNGSEKHLSKKERKRLEKIEKSDTIKDYSKLTEEEKKAAKEKAIREGNAKEAYRNINEFTYEELNNVKNRYNLNKDIKSINDQELEKGWKKLEKYSNRLNTLVNFTTNGIKLYDNVAQTVNAFNGIDGSSKGEGLPTIFAKAKNNKNDKNNNKSESLLRLEEKEERFKEKARKEKLSDDKKSHKEKRRLEKEEEKLKLEKRQYNLEKERKEFEKKKNKT